MLTLNTGFRNWTRSSSSSYLRGSRRLFKCGAQSSIGPMTQILGGITLGRHPVSVGRTKGPRTRRSVILVLVTCYVVDSSSVLQFLEGHMTVKPIVHEIRIQNQVIFLDPPIEYARQTWVRQLHDWIGEAWDCNCNVAGHLTGPLGVVCRLRRIQSSRYEIGLQMQSATVSETTYTSLV